MNTTYYKLAAAILILIVDIVAGLLPFYKRIKHAKIDASPKRRVQIDQAFSAGIFLGLGLLHMLPDAIDNFQKLKFKYPIALLITGLSFLTMLYFEHVVSDYQHQTLSTASKRQITLLALLILSIHSFFAGTAVGLSQQFFAINVLLFAILAHKWVCAYALAVKINSTSYGLNKAIILFLIFAIMTPLGIIIGQLAHYSSFNHIEISASFYAIAAGSFIYLGILHGLRNAVMIEQCQHHSAFLWLVLGFASMAILAVL